MPRLYPGMAAKNHIHGRLCPPCICGSLFRAKCSFKRNLGRPGFSTVARHKPNFSDVHTLTIFVCRPTQTKSTTCVHTSTPNYKDVAIKTKTLIGRAGGFDKHRRPKLLGGTVCSGHNNLGGCSLLGWAGWVKIDLRLT